MEQDEIYGEFAYVYDEFMDNIPYEQWHDYLHGLLIKYGVTDGIVADLACGTGTMTKLLADDGYDMIGVDMSYEMLEVARQKYCCQDFDEMTDESESKSDSLKDAMEDNAQEQETGESKNEILFLNQDMRELDLFGTAAAMVCVCDGMNYITDKNDLLKVFEKVKIFLDYGGIFIFDMKIYSVAGRLQRTERMQVLYGKMNFIKIQVSMSICLRYIVLLMMRTTFLKGRKKFITRGHMILSL